MRRTQTLNAATSVASHMLIVLWCWIMRRVHMAVPGRCMKYVHSVNVGGIGAGMHISQHHVVGGGSMHDVREHA